MISVLTGCSLQAKAPKGKLIYCSYAATGSAGLGKNYCELIADPGQPAKVVVVLNHDCRFADEIHEEYPATQASVDSLQQLLANAKVYKLNGYSVEEPISGGHSYRIYMEYDSGEKINARWYGHHIKDEAIAAYNMIEAFFEPWSKQAAAKQTIRR